MLTIRQAQRAIELFNKGTPYPAYDAVVAVTFSAELNPHSHLIRVSVLDALFGTNLSRSKPPRGRPRKPLEEISEAIRASCEDIEHRLQSLESQNLMMLNLGDGEVRRIIQSSVETVVSCCNNRAVSFATKYLHFVKPALFAPWDSVAREVAKRLLPEMAPEARGMATYVQLLIAHQRIWLSLTEEQQNGLLGYDFETQPDTWRRRNTPVRVVDKVLWATGKGIRYDSIALIKSSSLGQRAPVKP